MVSRPSFQVWVLREILGCLLLFVRVAADTADTALKSLTSSVPNRRIGFSAIQEKQDTDSRR